MSLRGHLDGLFGNTLRGWCFDESDPQIPVELDIIINDKLVDQIKADLLRIPLKERGLHVSGKCAFEYPCTAFDREEIIKIEVRSANGSTHLTNSPLLLKRPQLKLFYIHIPKTAGSSFNKDISSLFNKILKKTHIEGVTSAPDIEKLNALNFLSGHLNYLPTKAKYDTKTWKYLTIFRDPIKQLESHINWVLKISEDKSSDFYKGHSELVKNISDELRSMNVFSWEGKLKLKEKISKNIHYKNLFDNSQTKYIVGHKSEDLTAKDVAKAIELLSTEFSIVGLTEQYDDFLRLVSSKYDGKSFQSKVRQNENKKKIKIFETQDDISLFKDEIKFDQVVYDFVKLYWK